LYYYGHGVQEDETQAADWYHKTAMQGHVEAQYSLGFMYHNGQGIPQDDIQASDLYRKAAEGVHSLEEMRRLEFI
jgi:TPR repeat protein